jgi:hypothetical protein
MVFWVAVGGGCAGSSGNSVERDGSQAEDVAPEGPDMRVPGLEAGPAADSAVDADGAAGAGPDADARAELPDVAPDRTVTPDAAPPDMGPGPVPYVCAGQRVDPKTGARPAGCQHPALASQCVKVLGTPPLGAGQGACNIDSGEYEYRLCILAGWSCQQDSQCCGKLVSNGGTARCASGLCVK